MKHLLLFIFIIVLSACGSSDSETNSDLAGIDSSIIKNPLTLDDLSEDKAFVKLLEGTIGNLAVEMQIVIAADSSVRGSYFYKKYNTLLPFKGKISGDGRMLLAVYDITTDIVEYFKGRISDEWAFQGKWFKVEKNSKRLDFSMSLKEKITDKVSKSLEGTYELDTIGMEKKMTIRKAKNGKFQFQISLVSSCSGVIEGDWAYFQNDSTANFYGEEGCYVHFELRKDYINIKETDCLYYRGMQCGFDGNYRKTSNRIDWIDDFYEADDVDSLLDL